MVIIDNGHGKNTSGKRSPVWPNGTQLFEWEFNRDIVRRIAAELTIHGIEHTILVPEAIDISLGLRVKRANVISSNNPGSFLISIHGNASEEINKGSGWEAWTSSGETESDKIASLIYDSAKINLFDFDMRSDYADKDPDKESKFYILIKTICPAVLTENLFYTNEKDCLFMLSNYGRTVIAKLHVDAIIKYLNL